MAELRSAGCGGRVLGADVGPEYFRRSCLSIRKGALEHFQLKWLPVKLFGNATKQKAL